MYKSKKRNLYASMFLFGVHICFMLVVYYKNTRVKANYRVVRFSVCY